MWEIEGLFWQGLKPGILWLLIRHDYAAIVRSELLFASLTPDLKSGAKSCPDTGLVEPELLRWFSMLTATKAKISPGKLLIGGQWVEGSGKAFETVNPATGEVLTAVSEASEKDVDQ